MSYEHTNTDARVHSESRNEDGRWYGVKGDPDILLLVSRGGGGDGGVWRECGDLKEREKDRKMPSGRCQDK